MTQGDVAQKLEISESYFSSLLNGRYSAGKKLAMSLGRILGSEPDIWVFGSVNARKIAVRGYLNRCARAELEKRGRAAKTNTHSAL
jgi:transcriptional regulator with XRE-family HTH domain